ncbi:UPF0158 family protein [Methylobacter sp.]|uniref:UPF0158 family protein n=1 Tax=Methylobacter sp. TaxID=2051955 RepID=UPI003DA5B69E
MAAKLSDIINAIEFISADPALESEAFLSLNSGEIFIRSPDFEEELENCPDDVDDSTEYLPLPHKHDLGLGVRLAHAFIDEYRPSASDDVYAMFRRRGAYARFKDWADREGLLDEWHRYEDESKTAAVREWCNENDIEFSE